MKVISDLGISTSGLAFEHRPFPDDNTKQMRCDVWLCRADRPETLEFTHCADGDSSAAVIASYALSKIQAYARDYNLI